MEKVSDEEWQQLAAADFSSSSSSSWDGLCLSDRWILSSLHQLVDRVTALQEDYDFNNAGMTLYNYIWGEFADWYVEASKARLYSAGSSSSSSVDGSGEQEAAVSSNGSSDADAAAAAAAAAKTRAVLVYVFDRLLRLVHPFMPFISEELWQVRGWEAGLVGFCVCEGCGGAFFLAPSSGAQEDRRRCWPWLCLPCCVALSCCVHCCATITPPHPTHTMLDVEHRYCFIFRLLSTPPPPTPPQTPRPCPTVVSP